MHRSEYRQVATALRKVIKGRRLTYDDLGLKLGVSSRTVKRIIQGEDCSMSKLAEVCDVLEIRFFDLMRLAQEEEEEHFALTLEQEEFLAVQPKHFKFFSNLVNGLTPLDIKERYHLTSKVTDGYVKDLESFGLLERLNMQEIKLNVRGKAHTFLTGGPLSKLIAVHDMKKFTTQLLQSDSQGRSFSTSSGTFLTQKSIDEFIKASEELAAKFRLIAQRERSLFPEATLTKVRWLLGLVYPFSSWTDEIEL